ncbi:hypothetical protein N9N67_04420 [Bacteriovoracaceae bacterium]|nr:hypothetical protein [Bacteriovoracaceae bacterium]
MNFQFKQILLNKYQTDQIPNFLILHGPVHNFKFDQALQMWIDKLLLEIIQSSQSSASPNEHPDVLFINQKNDKSSLIKTADLGPLKDFLKFRPYSLKRKFIIIRDIYTQQMTVLNKLLKVLEDAPIPLTILATNPNSVTSIPTIKSRAIHFRFNQKDLECYLDKETMPEKAKDHPHFDSIPNIQSDYKSLNPVELADFFETLVKSATNQNYSSYQQILEIFKNHQTDKNYNLTRGFTSFLTHQLIKNP